MATFEGLKETLSRVAEYAREKTDLAVNTGKMAIELNRAKADANAARIQLADLVMDKYVGGQIADEEIAALCAEIEDADEQIVEMTLALDAIRQETVDGLRSVSDTVSNTVTGAVNSIFKKEADTGLVCPACGAALKEEFAFCPACGCGIETVDDIVEEAEAEAEAADATFGYCNGECEGCGGCDYEEDCDNMRCALCSNCGDTICFDEEMDPEKIVCPACGTPLVGPVDEE